MDTNLNLSENLSEKLEKDLHNIVERSIFLRGEEYYNSGAISKRSLNKQSKYVIVVNGVIEGADFYEVVLNVDIQINKFIYTDCSCPYDGVCKHIVALGLHMIDFLKKFEAEKFNKNFLGNYSENLFNQDHSDAIMHFAKENFQKKFETYFNNKNKSQQNINISQLNVTSLKKFDSSKFYIKLNYDLTPSFHRKGSWYESVNLDEILKNYDITLAQRELLEAIHNSTFDDFRNKDRDLLKLAQLIQGSNFIVSLVESYSSSNPVQFIIEPSEKLKGEIKIEKEVYYYENDLVKHNFYFTMPRDYWKGVYGYQQPFIVGNNQLAYISKNKNTISIYQMGKDLAQIISRVKEYIEYDYGGDSASSYYSGNKKPKIKKQEFNTKLTGEEIWKLDEIMRDAQIYLDLTNPLPVLLGINRSDTAKCAFVIDYNASENNLQISAIVDYNLLRQDVSKNIFYSTAGGKKHLAIRQEFNRYENYSTDSGETHRILFFNNILNIVKINIKKEKEVYRKVFDASFELGFSKNLSFNYKTKQKIFSFIKNNWSNLVEFAKKNNFEIYFKHDIISFEQASIRASFSIQSNPDNDWLYFDINCYCGENKLLLSDIINFVQSGDSFLHRADGSMLEVQNRAELERLVAMLRSFQKREDGFEGKLCQASELKYIVTSSKHYQSQQNKSFQEFMKKMETGKPVKSILIPSNFKKILRPYQQEGIYWMYFLRSYRFAGILADDMGLGKTFQAIVLLSMTQEENGGQNSTFVSKRSDLGEKAARNPSIVVCPKSLLQNWQNEVIKFAPKLKTLIYEGSSKERNLLVKQFKENDLIIVSYPTLRSDDLIFSNSDIKFNYAILDEAQFIKNHATKNAQIVKKINANYRLALTGTPLENNVSEIWSIFDFLMPGFLGRYEDFSKNFHKPIMDYGDMKALEHLSAKIRPFMLRRTKQEVLKELPEKIEQELICELGTAQNILYQQILKQVRAEVFSAVDTKGFKNSQIHILAGLMKLRQACNHPRLLLAKDSNKKNDKNKLQRSDLKNSNTLNVTKRSDLGNQDKELIPSESAKMDLAFELIEEAIEGKHKILIFSQFTSMLDIVAEELEKKKITYLYLSGKTKNRAELVDQFNNDTSNIPIFLISLKAGGTGLNLTGADTVIIFDPWWNPSVENQAADRAHRIGQTKTVNVYRLMTKGTIEEKINLLKAKKKSLADALINASGDTFKKLTWDDIRGLFS